jgi:hypothetical protein
LGQSAIETYLPPKRVYAARIRIPYTKDRQGAKEKTWGKNLGIPGFWAHLDSATKSSPPTLRQWSDDFAPESGILFIRAPADFTSVER